MTSATTNDWNTESGTERLMLRSCLKTAKHADTVIVTRDRIVTSLSIKMAKSRTFVDGSTWFAPT